jgi:hypothetical protein
MLLLRLTYYLIVDDTGLDSNNINISSREREGERNTIYGVHVHVSISSAIDQSKTNRTETSMYK